MYMECDIYHMYVRFAVDGLRLSMLFSIPYSVTDQQMEVPVCLGVIVL